MAEPSFIASDTDFPATPTVAVESSLIESDQRFHEIFNAIDAVIWMRDPHRHSFIYVSPAYARIWGRSLVSLYADPASFLDAIHPDDQFRVTAALPLQTLGSYDIEYRVLRPDGSVSWVHDVAFPIRDAYGVVVRVAGIAADITARLEAEGRLCELNLQLETRIVARTAELSEKIGALESTQKALTHSEEKYRLIFENVSEGIVLVQNRRFVFANPRACEIAGYSADELLRIEFPEVVHPDDRENVVDRHRRRLAGETVEARYDFRTLHRDGSATWIELGAVLIQWEGQVATLCFFTDISARKSLEENLRQTLLEREIVLEHSIVGIIFLNPLGRVQWINRGLHEMIGGPPDDLTGTSLERFYSTREEYLRVGEEVAAAVRAGRAYETELQLRRVDGALVWVYLSGQAVNRSDLSQGTVWVVVDISERKRAEADIQTALVQQKELNQMKSRFVSMTSHEFRTPLSTILSSAELLRHYHEKLGSNERNELFDSIENGVMRMTQMLDNILIIGKAEAECLECTPVELDLELLCREMAAEAESTFKTSSLRPELRLDLDAGHTPAVMDRKLLQHILGNLLSNALKYSSDGGVVELSLHVEDDVATFVVSDHGIGIPAAEMTKLFASFHRASNVGNIPGTGLGLTIVKKSVEAHGGRIKVNSEVGHGTKFTVELPANGLADGGCSINQLGLDACATCDWSGPDCLRNLV